MYVVSCKVDSLFSLFSNTAFIKLVFNESINYEDDHKEVATLIHFYYHREVNTSNVTMKFSLVWLPKSGFQAPSGQNPNHHNFRCMFY